MEHEYLEIHDEATWHKYRRADLTSTSISALFDLNPWNTEFEIFHAKKDGIELPFSDNERIHKGKRMEGYAAQEIARKHGWGVKPLNIYARIPELRVGSSFDFEVTCPKRGKGILEIKAVDFRRHKSNWSEEEIPPHIEIQVQHQMLCAPEYKWACVAAFVGIYEHFEYFFDADTELHQGLIRAAKRFWHAVDNGIEPMANYSRDGAMIAKLFPNTPLGVIDLSNDNRLSAAVLEYQEVKDRLKRDEARKDELKAEIHHKIGKAVGAKIVGGTIDAAWTKDSPGKIITAEMVGQVTGKKSGYRKLLVKEEKSV